MEPLPDIALVAAMVATGMILLEVALAVHSAKLRAAALIAVPLSLLLLAAFRLRDLRKGLTGLLLDRDLNRPGGVVAGLPLALVVFSAGRSRCAAVGTRDLRRPRR